MFDYDPRIACISKEELAENIMNSFSTMYLTMISIVQGVALGLLVFKAPEVIEWTDIFHPIWTGEYILTILSKIAHIVTTFLFIVLTWHSYFWLAAIAKWVPVIWDSLLFFVHGAFEFMLIESLSNLDSFAWFYFFGFIGLISAIQYKYNSKRLHDNNHKKTKPTQNTASINHSKKLKIWEKDAQELGNHIVNYKNNRGDFLLKHSMWFIPLIFVVDIINRVLPASWVTLQMPTSQIPFILIFKLGAIGIILIFQIILIFKHVNTQNKSIEILKKKDSVNNTLIFNNMLRNIKV